MKRRGGGSNYRCAGSNSEDLQACLFKAFGWNQAGLARRVRQNSVTCCWMIVVWQGRLVSLDRNNVDFLNDWEL